MTPRDPERGHPLPAQFPAAKLHPGRVSGGHGRRVPPHGRGAPCGAPAGAAASVPSRRAQPVRPRTTPETTRSRPTGPQRPACESLLPKRLALPIFASDPLSSVAYATQEILIVLTPAGTAFLYLAPWTAVAVVLLVTVVLSYRQVVRAYPSGAATTRSR